MLDEKDLLAIADLIDSRAKNRNITAGRNRSDSELSGKESRIGKEKY